MTQQAIHQSGWPPEIYTLLLDGAYDEAIERFEQLIEKESSLRSNYWYLGLLHILSGQEFEGQAIWSFKIAEAEDEQYGLWVDELVRILKSEGQRQATLNNLKMSWTLCQHIREITPRDSENLLRLIKLSRSLEIFEIEELHSLEILESLKEPSDFEPSLFHDIILDLLKKYPDSTTVIDLLKAGSLLLSENDQSFIETLIEVSAYVANVLCYPQQAIEILKVAKTLSPKNLDLLKYLSSYYQTCYQYDEAIEIAKECLHLSDTLIDAISANYILLTALMVSGQYWSEAEDCFAEHISLLRKFIHEDPQNLAQPTNQWMISSAFFQPYLRDDITLNREIQNKIASIYNRNVLRNYSQSIADFDTRIRAKASANPPLRIGYLSHCLRQHSVGWLARWLFKYHNREQFEIFSYLVDYKSSKQDALQTWIAQQSDHVCRPTLNARDIAAKISDDEIDLLIDLDSLTLDICCEVLALKPAPVQATWLGWDASGIPAIDYFIADSYVLPKDAEEHYSEKLVRMPNAYIAVDGFEMGIPSVNRESFNIPQDAVIYLSAQQGFKRHPDTVQLQMKILKEVPGSYFFIKNSHGDQSIKDFFIAMAEQEGIASDRLRFLPNVPSEMTHRANLGIADVVLDTYPYNGATTTMETLWVGIPLVTRVGQTFSSRNSYSMMINAGITEGIAWSDAEYVEWGVKLGREPKLREEISWKLRKSRQTAPLWNAKEFTQEMENAYRWMIEAGN